MHPVAGRANISKKAGVGILRQPTFLCRGAGIWANPSRAHQGKMYKHKITIISIQANAHTHTNNMTVLGARP